MIRLEDVSKYYRLGGRVLRVLDRLSLTVARGDFIAIMGPSGAGKSTLLNLLGCLDRPDRGSYRFDGIEVASRSDAERDRLRRERIGFVFQSAELVDYLELLDNVALPGIYSGMEQETRRRRARELLAAVGLENRLAHRPGELSGGERQRAALARALFHRPELLLADEPTGNLDRENAVRLIELLVSLNTAGQTVILITHSPDVADVAGRRFKLVNGVLKEQVRP